MGPTPHLAEFGNDEPIITKEDVDADPVRTSDRCQFREGHRPWRKDKRR